MSCTNTSSLAQLQKRIDALFQKSKPSYQQKFYGKNDNIAGMTSDTEIGDLGYTINDDSPENKRVLWTSDKIRSSYAMKPVVWKKPNMVRFTSDGKLMDASVRVDDAAVPSTETLWSSKKIRDRYTFPVNTSGIPEKTNMFTSDVVAAKLDQIQGVISQSRTGPKDALVEFRNNTVRPSPFFLQDSYGPSPTIAWTSARIARELAPSAVGSKPRHVAIFGSDGSLEDGGILADDSAQAGPNVLWSSSKFSQNIPKINDAKADPKTMYSSAKVSQLVSSTTMPPAASATEGDVAVMTALGATSDSHKRIDDSSGPSPDVMWSSARSVPEISSVQGAYIDGTMVTGSGTLMNSADLQKLLNSQTSQVLDGKMNLVPKAKAGNLAWFDAAGQLDDSSLAIDDKAQSSPSVLRSSQYVTSELGSMTSSAVARPRGGRPGDVTVFDKSGNVVGSGVKIDDASQGSVSSLWTSARVRSAADAMLTADTATPLAAPTSATFVKSLGDAGALLMDAQPGAKQGAVALFTSDGQLDAAGKLVVDDKATAASDVIWTSAKYDAAFSGVDPSIAFGQKMDKAPGTGIAVFGPKNQLQATNLVVNDPGSVWTSDRIKKYFDDSPYSVLDDSVRTAANMWSSDNTSKWIQSAVQQTQKTVPAAKQGELQVFGAGGQLADSKYRVDDAAPASDTVLWTSAKKFDADFQPMVVPQTKGALWALNGNTSFVVDDKADASATVLRSSAGSAGSFVAPKERTGGNLMMFDSSTEAVSTPVGFKPNSSSIATSADVQQFIASIEKKAYTFSIDATETFPVGAVTVGLKAVGVNRQLQFSGSGPLNVSYTYFQGTTKFYNSKTLTLSSTPTPLAEMILNPYEMYEVYLIDSAGKAWRLNLNMKDTRSVDMIVETLQ